MNVADPANHSVLTSQSQSLSSLPLADDAVAEPARLPGQSDSRRLPMADAPLTRLNAGYRSRDIITSPCNDLSCPLSLVINTQVRDHGWTPSSYHRWRSIIQTLWKPSTGAEKGGQHHRTWRLHETRRRACWTACAKHGKANRNMSHWRMVIRKEECPIRLQANNGHSPGSNTASSFCSAYRCYGLGTCS